MYSSWDRHIWVNGAMRKFRTRDVVAIIIFCIVARAWLTNLLDDSNDLIWLFNLLLTNLALVTLSNLALRISWQELKMVVGPTPHPFPSVWIFGLAFAYFAIEPGIQGIKTLLAANFAPEFVRENWDFWTPAFSRPQDPLHLALYFLILVLAAPVAEEFVFRGLLLRPWLSSPSFYHYAVGSSVFFALLHHQKSTLLPVFVFSLGMAYLYQRTHSLAACIAVHGLSNLLTGLQYYFVAHWFARPIALASEIQTWQAECIMFFGAIAIILCWLRHERKSRSL